MTTWTYGGTDLSTLGNITKLDDNFDMPNRRGNNITIPFRHGSIHVAKFFEERTITFGIAVMTANAAALETAMDTIFTLFTTEQRTLEVTREDSSVRNVLASVNKSIQTNRLDNRTARIVVEFTLASPFFRLSTSIADNTLTINSSPKAMTVTNPGSVTETDPTITIDGPFSSITITNSTTGAVLTYTGAIGASENVVIATAATGEYTAVLSAGSVNVIGNITHSGASSLMTFAPGNNTLAITSAGGDNTGTVKASFYAPFI